MAKTAEFFDWFHKAFADRESFDEYAKFAFCDVFENTGGWASLGKLYVLHTAMTHLDRETKEEYLEIGTYCGRSLIGALWHNDARAQVIDPFELFLPDGERIYKGWKKAIDSYNIGERITLHKVLCQDFEGNLPPIGVFYYDGNHDSGHTYEGLKRFVSYLADKAIILIDDYMIPGGNAQSVFPGYNLDVSTPVKTDVDKWLSENPDATLEAILPWEHQTALIRYERN
jgi:hypothetical protein